MTKRTPNSALRCLALAGIGIFLALRLGLADPIAVTVTVTQRAPIETLSATGDVTGVAMATAHTRYTLVGGDGQKIILQDAQGARYRIAVAATDYVPPAPTPMPAPATPPPVTNAVAQAPPPAAAPKPPASGYVPGQEPVMSGNKTIQFTGTCPAPAQQSRHIRYDFDLAQEHFWLYIPSGYDGHQPWGLVVYNSPQPTTEELPDGWGQVLNDDKLLFICPQQADNDQPNKRRQGLAVIAALEMMKLYNIDPARVYAAGYSGGAREASELGFHQSDIFHATIQCGGSDFYKAVPRTAVTDADLQANPGEYGLLDADEPDIDRARKNVKFVLITGSKDFRQHYLQDIYNGGYKPDGFKALLLDIPDLDHQPCSAHDLRAALDFIEAP
jgi:hypothetical protein